MEYQGRERTPSGGAEQTVDGVLDEVIELRLPAKPEQIPLVRLLAHSVVARADFGLDEIADAKMAVDEACTQLVALADPGAAELYCRFRPAAGSIEFTVSTTTSQAEPPSEHSFGWLVLTTLARSVSARQEAVPWGRYGVMTIELVLHGGSRAM
jgi:serine/threonine-protein kinase RsbW